VRAVIAAGDVAVVPLLDALERDPRLTRAVSFHRDFSRHRHLIGVHEAAHEALCEILGTRSLAASYSDLATHEGRLRLAAAMRRYRQEHGGQRPEARWFATLADDHASRDQWLEAAIAIVGADATGNAASGWGSAATTHGPRAHALMPGEPLRARQGPSVTELMVRRLSAFAQDGGPVGGGVPYRVNVLFAGRMAAALGRWDARGGADVLRAEVARTERFIAGATPLQDDFDAEYAAMCLALHAMALHRGGDPGALPRFLRWLRGVELARLGTNVHLVFEPLWVHHDAPEVQAFLAWAFGDPASPFVPLLRADRNNNALRLLSTPLVQVGAFRDRVVADLADRRRVGELRALSNGVTVEGDGGWQITTGAEPPLAPGARMPVLYGDVIAWHLRAAYAPTDAPPFAMHWPEARRDQARAALAEYLLRLPPPAAQ